MKEVGDEQLPEKLELGCGEKKPKGFYGVDKVDTESADSVIDLDDAPWDLPSDHFDHIRAMDLFEHIENSVQFLEEVHRIGKDGCMVEIRCPHQSSQNWTDPTHKRLCGWNTIKNYFTEEGEYSFYLEVNFEIVEQRFKYSSRKMHLPQRLLSPLFHRFPIIYEKTLLSKIFPSQNIYYKLEVDGSE